MWADLGGLRFAVLAKKSLVRRSLLSQFQPISSLSKPFSVTHDRYYHEIAACSLSKLIFSYFEIFTI